jgi:hypothetical protein
VNHCVDAAKELFEIRILDVGGYPFSFRRIELRASTGQPMPIHWNLLVAKL